MGNFALLPLLSRETGEGVGQGAGGGPGRGGGRGLGGNGEGAAGNRSTPLIWAEAACRGGATAAGGGERWQSYFLNPLVVSVN